MINFDGLIQRVNLMRDSKERAIAICLIVSYTNFLMDSHQLEQSEAKEILEQINDVEIFLKHYVSDEKKRIGSLINSIYILNPIYEDILKYASNYPIFNPNIPNVNLKKLISYAQAFLYSIDPNLINIYNRLIDNKFIVETDLDNYGGKCHKFDGDTSGIVLQHYTVNFYKVLAFVHEMGHAYYHYLTKSHPNLTRSKITSETIPRIFEQLFLVFLKEKHLIDENSIEQYERFFMTHQLHLTNSTYILNKLLIHGIVNSDFHVENIKANLLTKDYHRLSIIKPKNDEFKNYVSFVTNYYSYAFLLSMIMRENYIEDHKETIKLIKELPLLSESMNNIDFINMFDKTDYLNTTKKNISRVLSKTYYKK